MTGVMDEADREGFLVQIEQMMELGGVMQPELLAVRDDDFCLVHLTIEIEGVPWERYVVIRAVDGQLTLTVWFDDEHRIDALIDLDARWAETRRSTNTFAAPTADSEHRA